jgi:hypothetical protein
MIRVACFHAEYWEILDFFQFGKARDITSANSKKRIVTVAAAKDRSVNYCPFLGVIV